MIKKTDRHQGWISIRVFHLKVFSYDPKGRYTTHGGEKFKWAFTVVTLALSNMPMRERERTIAYLSGIFVSLPHAHPHPSTWILRCLACAWNALKCEIWHVRTEGLKSLGKRPRTCSRPANSPAWHRLVLKTKLRGTSDIKQIIFRALISRTCF